MPETINIYNRNNQYTTSNPFLDTKEKIKNNEINISRKDNCKTPFRMSIIGTRKTNECEDCEPNTKVLKDNHALYCCYDPYISNKQNKGGIIKNDFLYSNSHYLSSRNKTYEKNNKGNIINTQSISGSPHTYQGSLVDNSNNKVLPCHRITYKKSNYSHDTFGAVSQRNRINRLKYNAVNARLLTPKVNCDNYNSKCYDDNLARYRVDIAKPPSCNTRTIFNKKNFTNKKVSCDPNYKGPAEIEKPQVTYIFPKYIPQRMPPPENGLPSDYYHNQYINSFLNFNFTYQPLEFNTNYQNRNPAFIPGPVPTENTTDTNPDEIYNFNVTEDTVTYTTQTSEVTTVVETDVKTGITETEIFLTDSVRQEDILDGTPLLRILEVKIMNKTVRINIEHENISHWHYHLDNSEHNMVYGANTVIFNVNEYGTYTLNIHGVDLNHNILISAPAQILNITKPEPRYITSGSVATTASGNNAPSTSNTTNTGTTTNNTTTTTNTNSSSNNNGY